MKVYSFSLKFLSIIFLGLIMVIGFGWNTAKANNDRVEVLIGFESKPGPAEHRLIKSQGGEVTKELNRIDVLLVDLPEHAADKVTTAIEKVPNVSFVEENNTVHAHEQTTPWGIDRVFGNETHSFGTWETASGTGIRVAVLDTGIDENHEDLPALSGGVNTVDDTYYGSDGSGHGTHVAGTVAALDNDLGVVGVAPDIDLYAVKVLGDDGRGTDATVAAGIEWVVDQGNINVINMSLGGGHSLTIQRAVEDAYEAGVLLVASAGNSGPRPNTVNYPAAYPEVIAVSATDENDSFPSFSSRGSEVELSAPGVSILSTLPSNRYGKYSGTSMASPHVAGVAALVWSIDPNLTNIEVREILKSTAEDIGTSPDRQGNGLVRADLAVDSLDNGDGDEGGVEINTETVNATEISTSSAKLGGTLNLNNTESASVYFLWKESSVENWNQTATQTLTDASDFYQTVENLQSNTSYEFKAVAEAESVYEEGQTLSFTTLTEDTDGGDEVVTYPEITGVTYSTRTAGPWERVDVSWSVSHKEGELGWVETKILDGSDKVLDALTTDVSGATAEGTDNLKTRGTPEKIRVTVNAGGIETSETTEL